MMVVLARDLFLYVIADVQRRTTVVSGAVNLMLFRQEVRQAWQMLSKRRMMEGSRTSGWSLTSESVPQLLNTVSQALLFPFWALPYIQGFYVTIGDADVFISTKT
jgi:hypothetical protein